MKILFFITIFLLCVAANANELKTNAVFMQGSPDWVTGGRINKIVENIQSLLEWDIRRIKVYWYKNQNVFEDMHKFGPTVIAISRKSDNTVHLGPRVTNENFDGVFA